MPFDPFNVDAFRASAWVVVVWTFVCVAGECFKLVEGRYTKRVLAVTFACDLVAGALVVFWGRPTSSRLTPMLSLQVMQSSGKALDSRAVGGVQRADGVLRPRCGGARHRRRGLHREDGACTVRRPSCRPARPSRKGARASGQDRVDLRASTMLEACERRSA